jgi:hypothetical protein
MDLPRLVLSSAATALAALWVGAALLPRRRPSGVTIRAELRYGRRLRLFAIIVALTIPALLAWLVWRVPGQSVRHLNVFGAAFAVLGLMGGLLLLETERVRIYLVDDGIVALSPWRGRRALLLSEVQSVTYSRLNRWFVIVGKDGTTVRASRSLCGLPVLLQALYERAPARCAPAVKVFLERPRTVDSPARR